jgi:hypothetical protein
MQFKILQWYSNVQINNNTEPSPNLLSAIIFLLEDATIF